MIGINNYNRNKLFLRTNIDIWKQKKNISNNSVSMVFRGNPKF